MVTWCSNYVVYLYIFYLVLTVRRYNKLPYFLSVDSIKEKLLFVNRFFIQIRHAYLIRSIFRKMTSLRHRIVKFFNFEFTLMLKFFFNHIMKIIILNMLLIFWLSIKVIISQNYAIWLIFQYLTKSVLKLQMSIYVIFWCTWLFKMWSGDVDWT